MAKKFYRVHNKALTTETRKRTAIATIPASSQDRIKSRIKKRKFRGNYSDKPPYTRPVRTVV